jgi:hypothetical protein
MNLPKRLPKKAVKWCKCRLACSPQQGNWRRLYASGKGSGHTLFLSPSSRGRTCSGPIIFSNGCRQVAERCLLITPGTDRLFSSRDSSNEIPMSSTARPANADRLNTTTAGRHSWAGSFLPDWKQIPLRPLRTVPKRSERIQ